MDMTAEAISKVLEISTPITFTVKDVHGIETIHSSKPLHQVKAVAPEEAEIVTVFTLAGFAALINAKLEAKDFPTDFLIHVQDDRTVVLKARVCDEFGRRLDLVKAQPVPFDQFRFGQWMNQEEFAIALASKFADTPDKFYVLDLASSLTHDATSTSEDDGFTQRAIVKAGMRTKEAVTLKPKVELSPYRTFPEVDQPVSQFVFRARCDGEGAAPLLMLAEADGGRWKVDAITTIAQAMEAFGLNIPIIA